MLVDASYGRKTKTVILMDTDHVILSALAPEALGAKWDEEEKWTRQFLSDLVERAGLSESEMQRFEKIFRKTENIVKFKSREEENEVQELS